jgi:hypothetical protein
LDTGYEPLPGERRQIEGFDVIIEDYSASAAEPLSIARFIIGDYFYVIEGTISAKELEKVVSFWLQAKALRQFLCTDIICG